MSDDQTIEALAGVLRGMESFGSRAAHDVLTAIRYGDIPNVVYDADMADVTSRLKADLCVAQTEAESLPSEAAFDQVTAERDQARGSIAALTQTILDVKEELAKERSGKQSVIAEKWLMEVARDAAQEEARRQKCYATLAEEDIETARQLFVEAGALESYDGDYSASCLPECAKHIISQRDQAHSLLRRIVEASEYAPAGMYDLIEEARGALK